MMDGQILQANYVENQLNEMQENEVDKVEVMTITPYTKGYAIYNSAGHFKEGNISSKKAQKWWNQCINEGDLFQKKIFEWDDEICIISYGVITKFSNQSLNRYLPDPGIIAILLLIAGFIADIIWIAWNLKRKLVNEFDSIKEITVKIENQALDFDIYDSGIVEISGLLDSIHSMQMALMKSLENQWSQAHELKEQVASLAHDIKTPLTIIRGNLELLKETEKDELNLELLNYIDEGTSQLEDYTNILVEINTSGKGYKLNLSNYMLVDLVADIEREKNSLMSARGIEISLENNAGIREIRCDSMLLMRAIANIINNAADFAKSYVLIKVDDDGDHLYVHIIDDGSGFSEEDIKKSKKQLYMGDISRHGSKHFGMGLYIADTILEQHHGSVAVKNNVDGGGHVEICIPCK